MSELSVLVFEELKKNQLQRKTSNEKKNLVSQKAENYIFENLHTRWMVRSLEVEWSNQTSALKVINSRQRAW
jgi:hypothetical protein